MMNTQKLSKLTLIILGWLMLFTLQVSAQTNYPNGINKVPLQEFLDSLNTKLQKNEVDLTKQFSVEMQTTLNVDGTFEVSKTKFTKTEGDENIVTVAKSAIKAVGDSNALFYLRFIDVKNVNISVMQDDKITLVRLRSDMESASKAKITARGLNSSISVGKLAKQREINGGEKDELKRRSEIDQLYLLENTSITTEESSLILKISLPKKKTNELIKENLKILSQKKQN